MASNRIGRINEEIQRELSNLIRAVKDPRVKGMVSLTAVETTPDLRYAKVYVSALEEDKLEEMVKALKGAAGLLRRELGHAINLRFTPELQFIADRNIAYGMHIAGVLKQVLGDETHDKQEESQ